MSAKRLTSTVTSIIQKALGCGFVILVACWTPLPAAAESPVSIEIERLTGPGIRLQGFRARLTVDGLELAISSIQDQDGKPLVKSILARCGAAGWSAELVSCSEGSVQVTSELSPHPIRLSGQFSWQAPDLTRFAGDIQIAGLRAPASLSGGMANVLLESTLPATSVKALGQAFPWLLLAGIDYQSGQLSGSLKLQWPERSDSLIFRGELKDFSFDSQDGLQAGVGLGASIDLLMNPFSDEVQFRLDSRFSNGELLLTDFYTRIDNQARHLRVSGQASQSGWKLANLELNDPDVLSFKGAAEFNSELALLTLEADHLEISLPAAFDDYFSGLLASSTLADLTTSGWLGGSFSWRKGLPPVMDLDISGLEFKDSQSRFFIDGLSGSVKLSASRAASILSWQQARVFRLPVDPGQIRLNMSHQQISLAQPLIIGLLGGQLRLNRLLLEQVFSGAPSLIELNGELKGLSMPAFSRALGWPEMGGTLSGSIPSLSIVDGVASLGGELLFQVFDGQIRVNQLSVERPFGVLPTLAASMELENLDLEQLSGAFSFGKITGRLNGAVQDLRMQNWRLAAFDAWFETPVGYRGPKKISQRAVENIASIGGGGPGAALSGPLLGMFDEFSYRRIGLHCRLRNNICQMGGLDGSKPPFRIIEGAGIPRISVQGYNASVDWPQLLAELKAATRSTGPKTSQ